MHFLYVKEKKTKIIYVNFSLWCVSHNEYFHTQNMKEKKHTLSNICHGFNKAECEFIKWPQMVDSGGSNQLSLLVACVPQNKKFNESTYIGKGNWF